MSLNQISISVEYTNNGIPSTGLDPRITILVIEGSDDTNTVFTPLYENLPMKELTGSSLFSGMYTFNGVIASKKRYIWAVDAGTDSVDERIKRCALPIIAPDAIARGGGGARLESGFNGISKNLNNVVKKIEKRFEKLEKKEYPVFPMKEIESLVNELKTQQPKKDLIQSIIKSIPDLIKGDLTSKMDSSIKKIVTDTLNKEFIGLFKIIKEKNALDNPGIEKAVRGVVLDEFSKSTDELKKALSDSMNKELISALKVLMDDKVFKRMFFKMFGDKFLLTDK